MTRINSYPKVWNLGHAALAAWLEREPTVVVQEKVDGSQFSFRKETTEGPVEFRSKGQTLDPATDDKLFAASIAHIQLHYGCLVPGWTYRTEALFRPKHNTKAYGRTPSGHVVLFDVETGDQDWYDRQRLYDIAGSIEVEAAPILYQGRFPSLDELKALMETESFLGGAKVEGVVVKPAGRADAVYDERTGKTLMAKFVSGEFRESNARQRAKMKPSTVETMREFGQSVGGPARWEKAVQHLRESGDLVGEPKDIGPLMKEIARDVLEEEGEHIARILVKKYGRYVVKSAQAGFPEWYKMRIAEAQLNELEESALDPVELSDPPEPKWPAFWWEDRPKWGEYRYTRRSDHETVGHVWDNRDREDAGEDAGVDAVILEPGEAPERLGDDYGSVDEAKEAVEGWWQNETRRPAAEKR